MSVDHECAEIDELIPSMFVFLMMMSLMHLFLVLMYCHLISLLFELVTVLVPVEYLNIAIINVWSMIMTTALLEFNCFLLYLFRVIEPLWPMHSSMNRN